MNSHQRRLWSDMKRATDEYLAGVRNLPELVGALQGATDAGEFKDRDTLDAFYELWTPLEEYNATHGAAAAKASVQPHVVAMQSFLRERDER